MLRFVADRFDPPELDTAVSAAILQRVAAGADPPTLRLWTPQRSVAFGSQDRIRPGYGAAVAAVRSEGFAAVERLAGGRAAVFHEGTVAFAWALPEAEPRRAITARFREMAGLVVTALDVLGVTAGVGEVPGEYCPGEWSVHLGWRHKVMGVGQRLIRGAAHLGGVVVVSDPDLVNRALEPAYRRLGYEWSPAATGAVDLARPGLTVADVIAALQAAFTGGGHDLRGGALDEACLRLAAALAPRHAAPG